jgi:hypothetical protein
MEQIGKAQLNTDRFREEPVRTDAEKLQDADLEEIMCIVRDADWYQCREKAVTERPSWSKLYHLSDIRKNVMRPFLRKSFDGILEIGSGCGSVTGILAENAGRIDCVDSSARRCRINALRHQRFSNLTVYAGELEQVSLLLGIYSLIILEENASCRITAEKLKKLCQDHLDSDGELWILAENRLGIQYLAGMPEQLTGEFFSGLEGQKAEPPRNCSKQEWMNLLLQSGIDPKNISWFYPYPDCRFTMALYSDSRLPGPGELNIADNNFDRKRLMLFDERKVQQTFSENGLFSQFSNSFFIRISGSMDADAEENTPVYVKFSNERSPELSLYTVITAGNRVEKIAASPEGIGHLKHINRMQTELEKIYGENLQINRSRLEKDALELEFVRGKTYEARVNEILRTEGREAAVREIQSYLDLVIPTGGRVPFTGTDTGFAQVFGASAASAFPAGTESLPVSDIDLIMSNLICDKEKKILLDYEWTFDFPVPVDFLKFRVLFYFTEKAGNQELRTEELFARFGLQEEFIPVFMEMERSFQRYISENHTAVRDLYYQISPGVLPVRSLLEGKLAEENKKGLRLYYSGQEPFSEDHSELFPVKDRKASVTKYLPPEVTRLRLDPGEESCVCRVLKMEINGEEVRNPVSNGKRGREGVFVFSHPDPWFCLEDIQPGSVLALEMEIAPVDLDIMERLGGVFRPENPEEGRHEGLREKAGKIWKHKKS